jgi:hypothetical protein
VYDTASAPVGSSREKPLSSVSFQRHASIIQRFAEYPGKTSAAFLEQILSEQNSREDFRQSPEIIVADGTASVRVTLRLPKGQSGSPIFAITGGRCIYVAPGDDREWILDVVPDADESAATVSVLTKGEIVEYPLTVIPSVSGAVPAGLDTNTYSEFTRIAHEVIERKKRSE